MTPSPVAIVARLRTDQAIAWRIAEQVAEAFDSADTACAVIEASDGWLLELYLAGTVDQNSVRDIVALAVGVARANARANGVGDLVETIRAGGLAGSRFRQEAPFDLVLANILLQPLRQLAAPVARITAPGTRIVLSGLLTSQANTA